MSEENPRYFVVTVMVDLCKNETQVITFIAGPKYS